MRSIFTKYHASELAQLRRARLINTISAIAMISLFLLILAVAGNADMEVAQSLLAK